MKLTDEEKTLLVDCLVFSASADVVASWDEKDDEKMLALAKKIGVPASEKVKLWDDDGPFENKQLAEKIKEIFLA